MKVIHQETAISDKDQWILIAYRDAVAAQGDYALKAVICGLLLSEKRRSMETHSGMTSHSGKSSAWTDRTKPKEDQFGVWLESVGISKSRGYRWMEAADVVSRRCLGLAAGVEMAGTIDVEGTIIPLSQALMLPEAELPEAALEFRQGMFGFMRDKTLSEAVSEACDGGSPASRISRAANGKMEGGSAGEDRKDYALFVMRKLRETGAHLAHWDAMDAHQRNEVLTVFTSAMNGDEVNLSGRGKKGQARFEAWPDEVCETLLVLLRKRLKAKGWK